MGASATIARSGHSAGNVNQVPRGRVPSEREIQASVLAHWRVFGLPDTLVAAIPNQFAAGQYGLTKGLFDLIVFAPGLPVGFLELKSDRGRASPEQDRHRALLDKLRIKNEITFGRDAPIRVLEQWGVVRRTAGGNAA